MNPAAASESFAVALATCLELPEADADTPLLVAALQRAGIEARVLAWDDPRVDWSRARLTILRATWNYPLVADRFAAWVRDTARVTELWNPPPLVAWNLHKRYLVELVAHGVEVVPTELVERGSRVSLAEILERRGWSDVILKPAISASSMGTARVLATDLERGDAHLRGLLARGDALVQRYVSTVEDYGERSLVWVEGEITHAVRKRRRLEGEEESVSQSAVPMAAAELDLARRAVDVARELGGAAPMYARIDLAPDPASGRPLVMELELIEPSLYFSRGPAALDRMVAAVAARLAAG